MTHPDEHTTIPGSPDKQGRPKGVPMLHHINIKTTRKKEMVDWYRKVLGMEIVAEHPVATFLSNDQANHRIALGALPGISPDENRVYHDGLHHSGFEYNSFDELNAAYLRLRDEGIVPLISIDHGFTFSYYYADPDGNLVELQVDVFGDWGKSRQWAAEEMLKQQFMIGTVVDPAKVAEAYEQGMSFEEIHAKAETGLFNTSQLPDLRIPPPPPDAPPLLRF
jgi:catechol 2,3-dioxygenase